MSKKSLLMALLALVLSFVLVACGGSETSTDEPADNDSNGETTTEQPAEGQSGGDLVFSVPSDAVSLDPAGSNDMPSSNVQNNIYETLVYHNEDLELLPLLAESFEAIDDVTWEFKLREGVKFHDGSDFNAEVVKANIERILDPDLASPRSFLFTMVEEIKVVNEYTVQFITEYPFSPLPSHLAHNGAAMLSLPAIEADYAGVEAGKDPFAVTNENPVGTGPFKFDSWTPGEKIVIVNNEDYWGDPAHLDSITFSVVPEDLTRVGQLSTGDAHIMANLAPSDMARVDGTNGTNVYRENSVTLAYIGFNAQKEPFDNVKVRQAISMAINKDVILDGVMDGVGIPAKGPLAPGVFGYSENVDPLEFDVEKAKQLLAEAGYPDGFSTTIWTNDNRQRMDTAEVVQAQLKEIGVEVEIEVLEWGAYLEQTANGEHDMFILGWVIVTLDADYGTYPLFHSSNQGQAGNRTFTEVERLDEVLDAARREADPDTRIALYEEAQEILVEEATMVYTHFTENVLGVRDEVQGFWVHANGIYQLKDVTLN